MQHLETIDKTRPSFEREILATAVACLSSETMYTERTCTQSVVADEEAQALSVHMGFFPQQLSKFQKKNF